MQKTKRLSDRSLRRARKTKDRASWFNPAARGQKIGPFIVSMAETLNLDKTKTTRRKLVISLPRTCGNAVKRNRLRRIIRAHFSRWIKAASINKVLWIRLSRHYRLLPMNKANLADLKALLSQIEKKVLGL